MKNMLLLICGVELLAGVLLATPDEAQVKAVSAGDAVAISNCLASVDKSLPEVKQYNWGTSRRVLMQLSDLVQIASVDAKLAEQVEVRLLAALAAPATTEDAKGFICRKLALIGSDASTVQLAAMVGGSQPHAAEMAVFALSSIGSDAALKALLESLPQAKGVARQSLVNALGVGGNLQAVPVLKQLASGSNSELARVAASSLGRIGGDSAAAALLEIGHDRIGRHIGDALLVAADKSQLSPAVLVQVCDAVYNKAAVSAQRLPAARLLALKSNGADRLRLLQVALSDDSAGLRRAAMQMLGEIPADVAAPLIDSLVKNCHGADKIMLLGVVEKVGGTRNLAVVRSSLKSDNPTVRAAACQTLGQIGDVSDVNLLLEQAGQDKAAAAALVRLHGSDVTARLIAGLKDADESHKILLVDVMAKRGDAEIGMPLLGLLDDPSSRVQLAAAKALSRVSDLHAFDKMLATLNDAAVSSSVRSALEMSVALAGTRLADKRSVVRTTAAYASADKSGQISLLRIMGRMQDKSFVTLLSAVAGGKDAELRDAAVRALARWKDPAAVDTIIKVASQITDERQNALLLIGVSRILKATRHSKKNMLPQYEAARKAARRDSERKLFELKGK